MKASAAKRRRTESESSSDESSPENNAAPSYGSREYWEDRYKKNKDYTADGETLSESDALPFHSWYFTYDELRPLLLPLILGSEAMEGIMGDASVGDETDSNNEEEISSKKCGEEATEDKLPSVNESKEKENTNSESRKVQDPKTAESTDVNVYDSDEEVDVTGEREGLAKNGPISILEVGCGDVPLGKEIARDMLKMETETGEKAGNVVKSIVCCDYSETVIQMLMSSPLDAPQEEHTVSKTGTSSDGKNGETNSELQVQYVVADARKLPYAAGEINLVLEKGTLDAMLSDKENGVSNCISIVAECARVLTVGGYLVIISHLNAHTQSGLGWLDDVVVPGLRAGGGSSTWEIEIHANDDDDSGGGADINSTDDGPAQDDDSKSPSDSPGPAVYMIRKEAPENEQPVSAEIDHPPAVELKFFSY